jgi:hypothetical protein
MTTAVRLTVKNTSHQIRKTEIKLAINGGVTKSVQPWNAAYSPGEYDNDRTIDARRNAILCKSKRRRWSLDWSIATCLKLSTKFLAESSERVNTSSPMPVPSK